MAGENYKEVFSIGISDFFRDHYYSAIAGTFDASFFIDPATQQFRFPAYNTLFRGMIAIKDETKYRREYFSDMPAKQKAAFSLDDFEKNFIPPSFVIGEFDDFLNRIPDEAFNKGISKDNVLYLFKKFQRHINEELTEEYYLLDRDRSDDAIRLGLLTALAVDRAMERRLWDESGLPIYAIPATRIISPLLRKRLR